MAHRPWLAALLMQQEIDLPGRRPACRSERLAPSHSVRAPCAAQALAATEDPALGAQQELGGDGCMHNVPCAIDEQHGLASLFKRFSHALERLDASLQCVNVPEMWKKPSAKRELLFTELATAPIPAGAHANEVAGSV